MLKGNKCVSLSFSLANYCVGFTCMKYIFEIATHVNKPQPLNLKNFMAKMSANTLPTEGRFEL